MLSETIHEIISRSDADGKKIGAMSKLAEESGIGKSQLSRFLSTGSGISQDGLIRLARALKLRVIEGGKFVIPEDIEDHWINRLVERLRNNQAVVFIGSGFSRLATAKTANKNAKPMPLWGDIIVELCKILDEDPAEWERKPFRLLEYFINKEDENRLRSEVAKLTDDSRYDTGPSHRKLVSLPWHTIVTTNYDHLLERACDEAGIPCQSIFQQKDLALIDSKLPIIKIHGDRSDPSGMIVTEKDYDNWSGKYSLFANKLRNLLVEKQLTIIGASLEDPNWDKTYTWIRDKLQELNKTPLFFAYKATKGDLSDLKIQGITPVAYSSPEVLENFLDLLHERIHNTPRSSGKVRKKGVISDEPEWLPRYKAVMEKHYGSFDLSGFYWSGPAYARSDIRLQDIYQPPRMAIQKNDPNDMMEKGRENKALLSPDKGKHKGKSRRPATAPDPTGYYLPDWDLTHKDSDRMITGPALEGMAQHRRLVILGDPGSGKSLLLRRRFIEALTDPGSIFPVFLPLRRWAQELEKKPDISLEEFAVFHIAQQVDIGKEVLREYFQSSRIWWFLDGLDEVRYDPTGASGVRFLLLDHLRATADYRRNDRFTVTSRPSGYHQAPLSTSWQEAMLQPFDEEIEVLPFFERWFDLIREKESVDLGDHETIYKTAKEHNALQDLLRNPLLLTLIILFYKGGRRLPDNRREFYRYTFDTLGDRWLAAKRMVSGKDFPRRDILQPILERVGYGIQVLGAGRGLINTESLALWTREVLAERNIPFSEIDKETNLFLSVARSLVGIIVEQAPGYFGFLHLTFQEYAVALYLNNHITVAKKEMGRLSHPQWEEVWKLFLQEIARDQDKSQQVLDALLRLNEQGVEKLLHRPLVWALLALSECMANGDLEDKIEDILANYIQNPSISEPVFSFLARALSLCPRIVRGELLDTLLERLEDKNEDLRWAATLALSGVSSQPEVTRALLEQWEHIDWHPSISVTEALRSVASQPEIISALLVRLQDRDNDSRLAAALALSGVSSQPEVTRALLEQLKDTDRAVRAAVIHALSGASTQPEVTRALLEQLADNDSSIRRQAAEALCNVSSQPEVTRALLERLGDEDDAVSGFAVIGLSAVASQPEVTRALLERLDDTSFLLSMTTARVLSDTIASQPEVTRALLERLGNKDRRVRMLAADSLSGVASQPEVTRALLDRLGDKDGTVRRAATRALSDASTQPEVTHALLDRLGDKDRDIRWAATQALSGVAWQPEVTHALLDRLGDASLDIRRATTRALSGASTQPEVTRALLERLGDGDQTVRMLAADSLSGVASQPEVTRALLERLGDKDGEVSRAAWNSLRFIPVGMAIFDG